MTLPKAIVPGTTWMVTRRATRRHFLFRPDEDGTMSQIYWYATIYYAQKLGILVHVIQLLSDHLHEVLTDLLGRLPEFMEKRNRAIALAVKAHRGWPEEVMSSSDTSYVELPTAATMVEKMAYVVSNCVSAFLVRTPRRWPGAKVLVNEVGERVVRVKRPEHWFDADNPQWPEYVEMKLELPPLVEKVFGSLSAVRGAIQAVVDDKVREAHAEAKRQGKAFMGATRVLKVPFTDRADGDEEFGGRNPTYATAGDPEVAQGMAHKRRSFREGYREAWLRWRAGERDVEFPYGTYKLAVYHGVRCRPPP